tara:strand:- start:11531 stop:12406 length:876 start_codon:yes stop_codon:yes gene_type:complete
MKPIRLLSIAALAGLLGACAGNVVQDWNIAEVRALPQQGNKFQQALHSDYVALAQIEHDEGHWDAVSYYDIKARQAAIGAKVLPTTMAERSNPAEHVKELTEGRAVLMRMLDAGGPDKAPVLAARAQTQFDCWIEELEENFQPGDIALCRNGFFAALSQASSVVFAAADPAPKKVTPPPALAAISTYTVYFDHNSLVLSDVAMATNDEVIKRVKASGAKTVRVTGYTDTSGNHEYNSKLAERRANVVSNAIEMSGIKPIIDTQSYGEDRLAVQTGDNVREWQNRRVIIRVE